MAHFLHAAGHFLTLCYGALSLRGSCTSQTQANGQSRAFVCFRGWHTHFDGGGSRYS